MKITVPQDQLATATGWAAARLGRTPVAPVLGGLLLDAAADGTLTVSGYDYQTSATATLAAETGEPGRALISGRLLAEVTASLPADLLGVTIATDGTRAVLTAGQVTYTLQLLPHAEFPELPAPGPAVAEFGADHLAQAVALAAVAASHDDTLPVLTCVRLELDGRGMAMLAATDRYRIAVMSIPYKPLAPDARSGPLLIPARDLAAVVKKPAAATVTLGLTLREQMAGAPGNPGTAALTTGGRQVTMRLLEGEFPDFTRFINPDAARATVTAEATALSAAVKRAAVVAERNTPVRLTPGDGSLHIEAGTGDEAGYAEDIPVDLDGDPIPIAFNPAYLLDALAAATAAGSTRARIQLTDSVRPALIEPDPPPDGSVCLHVLMPIRSAG